MKIFCTSLFLIFSYTLIVAQTTQPSTSISTSEILINTDILPEFPGGTTALHKFIKGNMQYPPKAKKNEVGGTAYIVFVVGTDGTISDVRSLKVIGFGFDEEAIRIVKSMPKWKPGMQNGKTVKVQYSLPIKFDPHN